MIRRTFIQLLALGLGRTLHSTLSAPGSAASTSEPPNDTPPSSLTCTSALDLEGDLAKEMESDMARYFLRRTQQAPQERTTLALGLQFRREL